jgi:hypothetical protein
VGLPSVHYDYASQHSPFETEREPDLKIRFSSP